MRIGLHMSSRGGVVTALEAAGELHTSVAQLFIGNPRAWSVSALISDGTARQVRDATRRLGIAWFVHLPYLINIANPEPATVEKSTQALIDYCSTASAMGASGLVLHVGSHRGAGFEPVRQQIGTALLACADALDGGTTLLLENAAGQKGAVGSVLDELWVLLRDLPGAVRPSPGASRPNLRCTRSRYAPTY